MLGFGHFEKGVGWGGGEGMGIGMGGEEGGGGQRWKAKDAKPHLVLYLPPKFRISSPLQKGGWDGIQLDVTLCQHPHPLWWFLVRQQHLPTAESVSHIQLGHHP
jgi:hypothetical protein